MPARAIGVAIAATAVGLAPLAVRTATGRTGEVPGVAGDEREAWDLVGLLT